jgi:hypothetical protein
MLACLQLIFDPAVFLSSSLPESPLEILLLFGQDLKRSLVDLGSNREGSLVERIMVDLDLTRDTISSLQPSINNPSSSSAPQNPGNNQFAPPSGAGAGAEQGGQGTKLSVEMLRERVASLKLERKGLGHVLYLLSYGRSLRKKEVQGIIRWLAKNGGEGSVEDEGMVGYMATTALAAFDLRSGKGKSSPAHDLPIKALADQSPCLVLSDCSGTVPSGVPVHQDHDFRDRTYSLSHLQLP